MKTFVLYLFSILWAVMGLSNSEQDMCSKGAVAKVAAPTSYISSSSSTITHNSSAITFESTTNSVSSYATKNNNVEKEDVKHKTHNKSAIIGQKFYKLNSIHLSDTQSLSLISPEDALYVLADICRLKI